MNYAILGATSGIGEALAKLLVREGHSVGITGRRTERLGAIKREIEEAPGEIYIQTMDITKPDDAWDAYLALETALGHIDICVLNAGVSNYQGSEPWKWKHVLFKPMPLALLPCFGGFMSDLSNKDGGIWWGSPRLLD